jgi:protein involved in temperature-dependent protein secretion
MADPKALTMEAIGAGDYSGAHAVWQKVTDVDAKLQATVSAFLLALCERFNEAEKLCAQADLPGIAVIVRGERARLARWTDPEASCGLAVATDLAVAEHYAALATAFVRGDQALADKAKRELDAARVPVPGALTLIGGSQVRFADLSDADDAIGQMLEVYTGSGLLYFPFAALRRVEFLARDDFMDRLMPLVRITSDAGAGMGYVPLLYAGSARSPDDGVRNGTMTMFDYLGKARRGRGQRDLFADTRMIGLQNVAAIDFTRT